MSDGYKTIYVDFLIRHNLDCGVTYESIAHRNWPSAPDVGHTVFIPETGKHYDVVQVHWGSGVKEHRLGRPVCDVTLEERSEDE
jgi:hypothetical protein